MKTKYSYKTPLGAMYNGDSLNLIQELEDDSINLVITSPPFALLREKEYGNKDQSEYVEWLAQFGRLIYSKLKDNGSFVIDLGGAYKKGIPVRSLYNYRVLLYFCDILGYHLAEEFFWHNPSKLPGPIEWVNKRKIRVKDSVNTVWWFSKNKFPKSNISNVLVPYSEKMKKLIDNPDKYYRPKERPSGHNIGASFGKDNGGAIPANLLEISNSESNSHYLASCKSLDIKSHPARFPSKLPEFFIKMLTDEGDIVLDIFAGSNTTGQVAEELNRRWISFELDKQYVANSVFRFLSDREDVSSTYNSLLTGQKIDL